MQPAEKNHKYPIVSVELPNGNRNGGIGNGSRGKMGTGFKFQMGMKIKSLK